MRNRLFLSIIALIFLCEPLTWASEYESAQLNSSPVEITHLKKEWGSTDRYGKNFSVLASPVGFGYGSGFVVNQQLSFGYFLDENSIISVEGGISKSNYSEFWGPSFVTNTTSIGASYKRYFGNSFYVKGGAEYIQIISSGNYWEFMGGSGTGQIEGSAVAATLAVGNQWQWSEFTLGCDWAGVIEPITSNITTDTISGNVAYANSEQSDQKNRLFVYPTLEFARIYIGASF